MRHDLASPWPIKEDPVWFLSTSFVLLLNHKIWTSSYFLFDTEPRGWLCGHFLSQDEISTRFAVLKFLQLYGKFHPGMKTYQLGNNKWNFLFLSWNETKVTIIWRKMFHFGMNVSARGEIARMKFHLRMKYVIFYM